MIYLQFGVEMTDPVSYQSMPSGVTPPAVLSSRWSPFLKVAGTLRVPFAALDVTGQFRAKKFATRQERLRHAEHACYGTSASISRRLGKRRLRPATGNADRRGRRRPRAASTSERPSDKATARAPLNASPAAVASTAGTTCPGIRVASRSTTRHPSAPSVINDLPAAHSLQCAGRADTSTLRHIGRPPGRGTDQKGRLAGIRSQNIDQCQQIAIDDVCATPEPG